MHACFIFRQTATTDNLPTLFRTRFYWVKFGMNRNRNKHKLNQAQIIFFAFISLN